MPTRTTLLSSLFAFLALPLMTRAQEQPQLKVPVGLQLYSLRNQFTADGVDKTLDKVKAFGFKYVELAGTYGKSPTEFKAALEERGLTALSGHFGFDLWEKDPEGTAKQAADLGLKFAGVAWITHKGDLDERTARHAAE